MARKAKATEKATLEFWQDPTDGFWYCQRREGKKVTRGSFTCGYTTSTNCRRGAVREFGNLPLVRIYR